jgi:hypothetical protein
MELFENESPPSGEGLFWMCIEILNILERYDKV